MVKKIHNSFIIILILFSVCLPGNSGFLTLRDGVRGKIQIIDTAGCSIIFINAQGAKVSLQKTRVRTLEWNSKKIDFSSFECIGGTPAPAGTLEPSPRDALAAKLRNLCLKKEKGLIDTTVYYCPSPLNDIAISSTVDMVAAFLQDLFGRPITREISFEKAFSLLQDSVPRNEYLAICYSIRRREKPGSRTVSGAPAMTLSKDFKSDVRIIPTKEIDVRIIIVSLKTRCRIFDEVCTGSEKIENSGNIADPKFIDTQTAIGPEAINDVFFEIRTRLSEQGLIEKTGDYEELHHHLKEFNNR